jgi:hypothetical protein
MGLLTLVGGGRAADAPAQVLPDEDYPKMLKYAAKGIQDALKGSPKEEQITKARTAAIMVAAYAQQNLTGADGGQRAAVRDAALQIVETIEARKYTDAAKKAGELAALPADPKAKKEAIKLIDSRVKFKDLMNQFNHPPDGGWGIHREFYQYQLGMKGIPATELREPLLLKAYQVAVTADLIGMKTPTKNQKEWAAYAGDMKAGALELADAVRAKDGKAGVSAVAKVTTSCTNCHKIFGGGPK